MGDIADQIENEFWTRYMSEPEEREIPAYHWMTNQGEVLDMHNMSTTHLMNCIKFAGPIAKLEIETVLKERGEHG